MKINLYTDIDLVGDELRLSVATRSGITDLSRIDAIKLRNYLNEFINGNLDEEEEE